MKIQELKITISGTPIEMRNLEATSEELFKILETAEKVGRAIPEGYVLIDRETYMKHFAPEPMKPMKVPGVVG